jgi:hypothetical protein
MAPEFHFQGDFYGETFPLNTSFDLAKLEDPARDIVYHDWKYAQSNPIRGWDRRHDRYENFRIIDGEAATCRCSRLV